MAQNLTSQGEIFWNLLTLSCSKYLLRLKMFSKNDFHSSQFSLGGTAMRWSGLADNSLFSHYTLMFLTLWVCLGLQRKYIFISSTGTKRSQRSDRLWKSTKQDLELLTEGISFSSDLSRSPCSKNSLVTSSATCNTHSHQNHRPHSVGHAEQTKDSSDLFGNIPWFGDSTKVTCCHHHGPEIYPWLVNIKSVKILIYHLNFFRLMLIIQKHLWSIKNHVKVDFLTFKSR